MPLPNQNPYEEAASWLESKATPSSLKPWRNPEDLAAMRKDYAFQIARGIGGKDLSLPEYKKFFEDLGSAGMGSVTGGYDPDVAYVISEELKANMPPKARREYENYLRSKDKEHQLEESYRLKAREQELAKQYGIQPESVAKTEEQKQIAQQRFESPDVPVGSKLVATGPVGGEKFTIIGPNTDLEGLRELRKTSGYTELAVKGSNAAPQAVSQPVQQAPVNRIQDVKELATGNKMVTYLGKDGTVKKRIVTPLVFQQFQQMLQRQE